MHRPSAFWYCAWLDPRGPSRIFFLIVGRLAYFFGGFWLAAFFPADFWPAIIFDEFGGWGQLQLTTNGYFLLQRPLVPVRKVRNGVGRLIFYFRYALKWDQAAKPKSKQEVKVIWQKAPHRGPIPLLGVTPRGSKFVPLNSWGRVSY